MGLLCLLLANVILAVTFDLSITWLALFIVILFIDAFYIYCIYWKLKHKKSFIPKELTKRLGLIFNIIAVVICCNILYKQYFNPSSIQVHNEFIQCSLYKNDLQMSESYSKLIPIEMKMTIIETSNSMDMAAEFIRRKDTCKTEEEVHALELEISEYVETQKNKFEDIKVEVENQTYYMYAMIGRIVLYILLWDATDVFKFIKKCTLKKLTSLVK